MSYVLKIKLEEQNDLASDNVNDNDPDLSINESDILNTLKTFVKGMNL